MIKLKNTELYILVIYPLCHVASEAQDMVQIGAIPSSIISSLSIQRMIKGNHNEQRILKDHN